jgi:tetratricopeptide (TPR) repeat protein
LKDWDGAAKDYESAIPLNPANAFLRLWLADTYLEAGKLEEVKRCLELGSKDNPTNEQFLLRLATVHLLLKDPAGYRATCERMLDQFDAAKDPNTANTVAWVCALAPNAVKEPNRAVGLAKRAVEIQPWNNSALDTLGAVLYRSGNFDGTIERLNASGFSSRSDRTTVYDRLFLAMACQGAGRAEDAKVLLERVIPQLEPHQHKTGVPPQPLVMDVWQRKELELLREEAEKLIRPGR